MKKQKEKPDPICQGFDQLIKEMREFRKKMEATRAKWQEQESQQKKKRNKKAS